MSRYQKMLVLGMMALVVYVFLNPNEGDGQLPGYLDISVSGSREVNILGLSLGNTSLSQAEEILSRHSKRALFISKDSNNKEKMQIEAFFESIFDSDKLVLVLEPDDEILSIIKDAAYKPYIFPNGDLKISISDQHSKLLDDLKVQSVTYMPYRPINKLLFDEYYGEHKREIRNNGEVHFLYPQYGLDFIRVPGQDIFQLVEPRYFSRLTKPFSNAQSTKVK